MWREIRGAKGFLEKFKEQLFECGVGGAAGGAGGWNSSSSVLPGGGGYGGGEGSVPATEEPVDEEARIHMAVLARVDECLAAGEAEQERVHEQLDEERRVRLTAHARPNSPGLATPHLVACLAAHRRCLLCALRVV